MPGKASRKNDAPTVVIRREEVVDGGHHGGAWKVAYADFVTAMMAFFLLMWLLNATTEDQRKGLADYFSPNNLMSHASSGTGQPFGGHTVFDTGGLVSDRGSVQVTVGPRPVVPQPDDETVQPSVPQAPPDQEGGNQGPMDTAQAERQTASMDAPAATPPAATPPPSDATATPQSPQPPPPPQQADTAASEREQQERQAFEDAAKQIREAVRADPALAELAKQLAIDITPEGLRIQLLDEDRLPMFAFGSAAPNERARLLLQKVVPVLNHLTQPISIAGHTDAAPFTGSSRSNWELSTERANATRRLLEEGGMPDTRVRTVTGHADRELLLPAEPLAAANRRIAIVVLRTANTPAENH
jgi:chemotaxis protein MotB